MMLSLYGLIVIVYVKGLQYDMKSQSQKLPENENLVVSNSDKEHLWQRAISTIYHLKLWIVLLFFILLMVCFYVLDAFKDSIPAPWNWVRFLPWQSLAGTALGVVLIAFAYEWFVRKETEEKLIQMLKEHLHFQEEIIGNHIAKAMLFDKEIMRRVLAPDMMDDVLRTGLEIRLGDDQLARETYDNLLSQLLISHERRSNYRCKISLTNIRDRGVADNIKQKYYEGYIEERYDTVLQKTSFLFVCVGKTEEYDELLRDTRWELRWIAEPTKDFPIVDGSIFHIESVSVDGLSLDIKSDTVGGKYMVTADHKALQAMLGRSVTVFYRYKVKVQKRGHLLRVNMPCPTKNVVVELDYRDTDIHFVNVHNFFVSNAEPILRFPSQQSPRRIEIEVNGWVFPKGGVIFGWVLRSEMTPDFLRLLAEESH